MSELKPCPFCGGTVNEHDYLSDKHIRWCWHCGCSGPPKETALEAWASWNRRAAPVESGVRIPLNQRPIYSADEIDAIVKGGAAPDEASRAPAPISDAELLRLWGPRSDGPDNDEIITFARALLAQSQEGQPATSREQGDDARDAARYRTWAAAWLSIENETDTGAACDLVLNAAEAQSLTQLGAIIDRAMVDAELRKGAAIDLAARSVKP